MSFSKFSSSHHDIEKVGFTAVGIEKLFCGVEIATAG